MSSVYNSWNYTATSSLTKQKEENYLPWSVSSAFTRPTSTNSRKRSFMIDDILKEDSRDIEGRQWILPLLAGMKISLSIIDVFYIHAMHEMERTSALFKWM